MHVEPIAAPGETVIDQIHYLAELQRIHAHDIHVREVSGKLEADFDIEVHADMDLSGAHAIATRLEQAILQSNRQVRRVTTHLEAPQSTIVPRQDITQQYPEMAAHICILADGIAGAGSAHDVHLYRSQPEHKPDHDRTGTGEDNQGLDLVLHTIFEAHAPISQVHLWAEEIQHALRQAYPHLASVVIHTEPPE